MNDSFYEQIIVRKRNIYDHISIFIAVAFFIMLALLSIILLNPILLIILIILAFASYHFKIPNTRLEFEYSMLNSELNIDMILNKAKRKHMCSFNIKDVKLLSYKDSPELKKYSGTKQYNYSSNDENITTYILIVTQNNTTTAYMLDLDEELLNLIKAYIPRQIKI